MANKICDICELSIDRKGQQIMNFSKKREHDLSAKELKDLRGELVIILPFFLFSLFIFLGSFQHKFEVKAVPLLVGAITTLLTGMRLFHIIFPRSKIGQFKGASLTREFDNLQEEIEEETRKVRYQKEPTPTKEITFRDEKKAFIALVGSFVAFLLFGYMVGMFFIIVGISYYYGQKKKGQIFISLFAMYFVCYLIIYKALEAPMDYGLLLEPILKLLHLI
jgi:hypothetical protein